MAKPENKLTCTGCAAHLPFDSDADTVTCDYCGVVMEIDRQEEAGEDTPELIIPMAVEKEALENAVYEHLASGLYTPDNLLKQAVSRQSFPR